MHKLVRVGACTMVALSLFACGGDEEEEPPPDNTDNGTLNEALVEDSAVTAYEATQTAIDSGDGETSAFQLLSVGASALGMVTPGSGGTQPMGLGEAQQALNQGTCECTANSCTFTDCGDGTGYTITGSLSWTDSSMTCDYTVGGSNGAQTFNYSILCDLSYTSTSLDGTLSTSGDIDASGQQTTFDTDLSFNMVTFDASGPTGGSIDVSATVGVAGQEYSASGSVEF
jgi:hypothetical protein